jgi:ABC-type Zn2+ transport system substrate-binding protein/surface adhesin
MKKNRLNKMQRQVRSRRKTWTSAERFDKTMKNRERLAKIENAARVQAMAQQFIQAAQEEQHHHSENEDHTHEEHEEHGDQDV